MSNGGKKIGNIYDPNFVMPEANSSLQNKPYELIGIARGEGPMPILPEPKELDIEKENKLPIRTSKEDAQARMSLIDKRLIQLENELLNKKAEMGRKFNLQMMLPRKKQEMVDYVNTLVKEINSLEEKKTLLENEFVDTRDIDFQIADLRGELEQITSERNTWLKINQTMDSKMMPTSYGISPAAMKSAPDIEKPELTLDELRQSEYFINELISQLTERKKELLESAFPVDEDVKKEILNNTGSYSGNINDFTLSQKYDRSTRSKVLNDEIQGVYDSLNKDISDKEIASGNTKELMTARGMFNNPPEDLDEADWKTIRDIYNSTKITDEYKESGFIQKRNILNSALKKYISENVYTDVEDPVEHKKNLEKKLAPGLGSMMMFSNDGTISLNGLLMITEMMNSNVKDRKLDLENQQTIAENTRDKIIKEKGEDNYNTYMKNLKDELRLLKDFEEMSKSIMNMNFSDSRFYEYIKQGLTNVPVKNMLDGGISEMMQKFRIGDIAERAVHGEVNWTEKQVLDVYTLMNMANRSDEVPSWYKVGYQVSNMIPYVISFGATTPLYSIGKGTTKAVTKKIAGGLAKTKLARQLPMTRSVVLPKNIAKIYGKSTFSMPEFIAASASKLSGAALQTAFQPMLQTSLVEKTLPKMEIVYDPEMNNVYNRIEANTPEEYKKGKRDALSETFMEILTERMGPYIMRGMKVPRAVMSSEEAMKKFFLSKYINLKGVSNPKKAVESFVSKRLGWNGFVEEYMEEFVNYFGSRAFTGESRPDPGFFEDQFVTAASILMFGTGMKIGTEAMSGFQGLLYGDNVKYTWKDADGKKKKVVLPRNLNNQLVELYENNDDYAKPVLEFLTKHDKELSDDQVAFILESTLNKQASKVMQKTADNIAKTQTQKSQKKKSDQTKSPVQTKIPFEEPVIEHQQVAEPEVELTEKEISEIDRHNERVVAEHPDLARTGLLIETLSGQLEVPTYDEMLNRVGEITERLKMISQVDERGQLIIENDEVKVLTDQLDVLEREINQNIQGETVEFKYLFSSEKNIQLRKELRQGKKLSGKITKQKNARYRVELDDGRVVSAYRFPKVTPEELEAMKDKKLSLDIRRKKVENKQTGKDETIEQVILKDGNRHLLVLENRDDEQIKNLQQKSEELSAFLATERKTFRRLIKPSGIAYAGLPIPVDEEVYKSLARLVRGYLEKGINDIRIIIEHLKNYIRTNQRMKMEEKRQLIKAIDGNVITIQKIISDYHKEKQKAFSPENMEDLGFDNPDVAFQSGEQKLISHLTTFRTIWRDVAAVSDSPAEDVERRFYEISKMDELNNVVDSDTYLAFLDSIPAEDQLTANLLHYLSQRPYDEMVSVFDFYRNVFLVRNYGILLMDSETPTVKIDFLNAPNKFQKFVDLYYKAITQYEFGGKTGHEAARSEITKHTRDARQRQIRIDDESLTAQEKTDIRIEQWEEDLKLLSKLTGINIPTWRSYFQEKTGETRFATKRGSAQKETFSTYRELLSTDTFVGNYPRIQSNIMAALSRVQRESKDLDDFKNKLDIFFTFPEFYSDGSVKSDPNLYKLSTAIEDPDEVALSGIDLKKDRFSSFIQNNHVFSEAKGQGREIIVLNGLHNLKLNKNEKGTVGSKVSANDIWFSAIQFYLQNPGRYFQYMGQFGDKSKLLFINSPKYSPTKKDYEEMLEKFPDFYKSAEHIYKEVIYPYQEYFLYRKQGILQGPARNVQVYEVYAKDKKTPSDLKVLKSLALEYTYNFAVNIESINNDFHGDISQYGKADHKGQVKVRGIVGMFKRGGSSISPGYTPDPNVKGGVGKTYRTLVVDDELIDGRELLNGMSVFSGNFMKKLAVSMGSVYNKLNSRTGFERLTTVKGLYSSLNKETGKRGLNKVNSVNIDTLVDIDKKGKLKWKYLQDLMKKYKVDEITFTSGNKHIEDPSKKPVKIFDPIGNILPGVKISEENIITRSTHNYFIQQDLRHSNVPSEKKMVSQQFINMMSTPNADEIAGIVNAMQHNAIIELEELFAKNGNKDLKIQWIRENLSPSNQPEVIRMIEEGVGFNEPSIKNILLAMAGSYITERILKIPINRTTTIELPDFDSLCESRREFVWKDQDGNRHTKVLLPDIITNAAGVRAHYYHFINQPDRAIKYVLENAEQYPDLFDENGNLMEWEITGRDGVIPGEPMISTRVPAEHPRAHTVGRLAINMSEGNFTILDAESQRISGSDYDGDARYNQFLFKDENNRIIMDESQYGLSNQMMMQVYYGYTNPSMTPILSIPINTDAYSDLVKKLRDQETDYDSHDSRAYMEGRKHNNVGIDLKGYITDMVTIYNIGRMYGVEINSGIILPWTKQRGEEVKGRPIEKSEFISDPNEYTDHSGGAIGSDSVWDRIGKSFGLKKFKHYYHGSKTPLGNTEITQAQLEEGWQHVLKANETLQRKPEQYKSLLSRNWFQVKNADAVFAIGALDVFRNIVDGGTGWAVQMAIDSRKPVYVFSAGSWWKYTDKGFIQTETPTLTKNFAGIGTRGEKGNIGAKAEQAIRDVYEKTFLGKTTKKRTVKQATELTRFVPDKFGRMNEHLTNLLNIVFDNAKDPQAELMGLNEVTIAMWFSGVMCNPNLEVTEDMTADEHYDLIYKAIEEQVDYFRSDLVQYFVDEVRKQNGGLEKKDRDVVREWMLKKFPEDEVTDLLNFYMNTADLSEIRKFYRLTQNAPKSATELYSASILLKKFYNGKFRMFKPENFFYPDISNLDPELKIEFSIIPRFLRFMRDHIYNEAVEFHGIGVNIRNYIHYIINRQVIEKYQDRAITKSLTTRQFSIISRLLNNILAVRAVNKEKTYEQVRNDVLEMFEKTLKAKNAFLNKLTVIPSRRGKFLGLSPQYRRSVISEYNMIEIHNGFNSLPDDFKELLVQYAFHHYGTSSSRFNGSYYALVSDQYKMEISDLVEEELEDWILGRVSSTDQYNIAEYIVHSMNDPEITSWWDKDTGFASNYNINIASTGTNIQLDFDALESAVGIIDEDGQRDWNQTYGFAGLREQIARGLKTEMPKFFRDFVPWAQKVVAAKENRSHFFPDIDEQIDEDELKDMLAEDVVGEALASDDPDLQNFILDHLKKIYPDVAFFRDRASFFEFLRKNGARIYNISPGAIGHALGNAVFADPQQASQSTVLHEYAHIYWDALPADHQVKQDLMALYAEEYPDLAGSPLKLEEKIITDIGRAAYNIAEAELSASRLNRFEQFLKKFWEAVKKFFGKYKGRNLIDEVAEAVWTNQDSIKSESVAGTTILKNMLGETSDAFYDERQDAYFVGKKIYERVSAYSRFTKLTPFDEVKQAAKQADKEDDKHLEKYGHTMSPTDRINYEFDIRSRWDREREAGEVISQVAKQVFGGKPLTKQQIRSFFKSTAEYEQLKNSIQTLKDYILQKYPNAKFRVDKITYSHKHELAGQIPLKVEIGKNQYILVNFKSVKEPFKTADGRFTPYYVNAYGKQLKDPFPETVPDTRESENLIRMGAYVMMEEDIGFDIMETWTVPVLRGINDDGQIVLAKIPTEASDIRGNIIVIPWRDANGSVNTNNRKWISESMKNFYTDRKKKQAKNKIDEDGLIKAGCSPRIVESLKTALNFWGSRYNLENLEYTNIEETLGIGLKSLINNLFSPEMGYQMRDVRGAQAIPMRYLFFLASENIPKEKYEKNKDEYEKEIQIDRYANLSINPDYAGATKHRIVSGYSDYTFEEAGHGTLKEVDEIAQVVEMPGEDGGIEYKLLFYTVQSIDTKRRIIHTINQRTGRDFSFRSVDPKFGFMKIVENDPSVNLSYNPKYKYDIITSTDHFYKRLGSEAFPNNPLAYQDYLERVRYIDRFLEHNDTFEKLRETLNNKQKLEQIYEDIRGDENLHFQYLQRLIRESLWAHWLADAMREEAIESRPDEARLITLNAYFLLTANEKEKDAMFNFDIRSLIKHMPYLPSADMVNAKYIPFHLIISGVRAAYHDTLRAQIELRVRASSLFGKVDHTKLIRRIGNSDFYNKPTHPGLTENERDFLSMIYEFHYTYDQRYKTYKHTANNYPIYIVANKMFATKAELAERYGSRKHGRLMHELLQPQAYDEIEIDEVRFVNNRYEKTGKKTTLKFVKEAFHYSYSDKGKMKMLLGTKWRHRLSRIPLIPINPGLLKYYDRAARYLYDNKKNTDSEIKRRKARIPVQGRSRIKSGFESNHFEEAAVHVLEGLIFDHYMKSLLAPIDEIQTMAQDGSDVIEWVRDYTEMVIFHRAKDNINRDVRKAANRILRLSSLNKIAFNIPVQIKNLLIGMVMNLTREPEAFGRGVWKIISTMIDPRKDTELLKVLRIMRKNNLVISMMDDSRFSELERETERLILKNKNLKKQGRPTISFWQWLIEKGYVPMEFMETIIQVPLFMGLMTDSEYKAYDMKGEVIDPKNALNAARRERILRVLRNVHGHYGVLEANPGWMTVFGSFVFQFRKWGPAMYNREFGMYMVDKNYQNTSGALSSAFNIAFNSFKVLKYNKKSDQERKRIADKRLAELAKKGLYDQVFYTGFQEYLDRIIADTKGGKINWKSLSRNDVKNLWSTAFQLIAYSAMYFGALALAGDDDDPFIEKNKKLLMWFYLRFLNSFASEIYFFADLKNIENLLDSPAPAASIIMGTVKMLRDFWAWIKGFGKESDIEFPDIWNSQLASNGGIYLKDTPYAYNEQLPKWPMDITYIIPFGSQIRATTSWYVTARKYLTHVDPTERLKNAGYPDDFIEEVKKKLPEDRFSVLDVMKQNKVYRSLQTVNNIIDQVYTVKTYLEREGMEYNEDLILKYIRYFEIKEEEGEGLKDIEHALEAMDFVYMYENKLLPRQEEYEEALDITLKIIDRVNAPLTRKMEKRIIEDVEKRNE